MPKVASREAWLRARKELLSRRASASRPSPTWTRTRRSSPPRWQRRAAPKRQETFAGKLARKPRVVRSPSPGCANDTHDPAPENVAAKRCASEKRTREGHAAPHPEGFDPTLESPPDRHAAVSSALRLRDSPRLMLFGRGCTQWRGHGCFTSRNLDEGASGTCARPS